MDFSNNKVIVELENGGIINSLGYFPKDNKNRTEDDYIEAKEVNIAYLYISKNFKKQVKINKNISSYGLKQIIAKQLDTYISNCACILAMSLAGFKIDTSDELNVHFNLEFK